MNDDSSVSDDDPFVESDDWIAAQARQLFRAVRAADMKAVEMSLFYFEDYLAKTLRRHLRERLPEWDGARRWFDGLGPSMPEYPSPGWLRIRSTIAWVAGQEAWYYDPFEFELELCPNTGAFRAYVFRFGDHRPLSAKGERGAESTPPSGGWAFEFRRSRAVPA